MDKFLIQIQPRNSYKLRASHTSSFVLEHEEETTTLKKISKKLGDLSREPFQLLANYYSQAIEQVLGESREEHGKQRSGNLLIALEDFESFDATVLEGVLDQISHYYDPVKLPFVLLFGVTTNSA